VRRCTRFCMTAQRKTKTAGAGAGFGFHVSRKRETGTTPAGIRAFQAYPWKTLGRGEIRLTAVPGRILTGTGVKHLLSHACTPQ
jgi:hypothetical protein